MESIGWSDFERIELRVATVVSSRQPPALHLFDSGGTDENDRIEATDGDPELFYWCPVTRGRRTGRRLASPSCRVPEMHNSALVRFARPDHVAAAILDRHNTLLSEF